MKRGRASTLVRVMEHWACDGTLGVWLRLPYLLVVGRLLMHPLMFYAFAVARVAVSPSIWHLCDPVAGERLINPLR